MSLPSVPLPCETWEESSEEIDLHVGDRGSERVFVGGDEIPERADQGVDLEAGEALGEVFHAGSDVIDLLHHGAQVGLFGGGDILVVLQGLAARRAEIDRDEVLPEQADELDRGDAVGLDLGGGAQFHRDQHPVVGELDACTRPISTPAIFTRSPSLRSWTLAKRALTCLPCSERSRSCQPFPE